MEKSSSIYVHVMPLTGSCALGAFLQEKNQANQVLLEELTERAATLEREKRRLQNALEKVTSSAQVLTDARNLVLWHFNHASSKPLHLKVGTADVFCMSPACQSLTS